MVTETRPITLHADKEHQGLRIAVILILVLAFILAFIIFYFFITGQAPSDIADYAVVISCSSALVISLAIGGIGEYFLKRNWHSGQMLILDDGGIEVKRTDADNVQLEWSKRFSSLKWRFPLKGYPRGGRERRAPSKSHCLACMIQQDEARFIVYSFIPPKTLKKWTAIENFHELDFSDFYDEGPLRRAITAPTRPELPPNLLTGSEGPYWLAEQRRWKEGLELTSEDFSILMDKLIEQEERLT